jgi:tricorn protease
MPHDHNTIKSLVLGAALIGFALIANKLSAKGGVEALPTAPSASAEPAASSPAIAPDAPRLLQRPTLSRTHIAFEYAGEIWTVPRDGGAAQRLITGQLVNARPVYSPDGTQIAFTGVYDGNADVYVVAATGGEPRRLTYHPSGDTALGWTPDGKRILFRSMRHTPRDLPKLFTVSVDGGFPEELPLPSGSQGVFSPDGKRVAYIPFGQWQPQWKKYRGGQTTPVWVADLADSKITKVPRENSNDRYPMWVGDKVYFLSDRNGAFTLFSYDAGGGQVQELIKNTDGLDMRFASAGPGAIVIEQLGKISLYDLASKTTRGVPITISADLPQVRARFEKVHPKQVLHAALSPTGKRAVFEVRGEILSIPAEKGDVRNITRSPGAADRDPSLSPDGKWIAWFSDDSGEYALHFRAPDGQGPVKTLELGTPPSYFYEPRWSPDSKKLLIADKRLNLWMIDLDNPALQKIDTDRYDFSNFQAAWSPDSRFVAYAKQLQSYFHAVFVYSVKDKVSRQVTDGRSEAFSPRFDRSGKYLWFLASTDAGLAQTGGMYAFGRPVTSSLYAMVLDKKLPSPMAPESDEEGAANKDKEKATKDKKDDKAEPAAPKGASPVVIDFEGLDQRIVSFPVDRANYVELNEGPEGVVFLSQAPLTFSDEDYFEVDEEPIPLDVLRFDLKPRKGEKFVEKMDGGRHGLQTFVVSADGSKVLYEKDKKWFVVPSDKPAKPGEGALKTGEIEVWIDPRAEWRQIYHEVWRIERDFLYDPKAHGLDLGETERFYARYLDAIASRDDLNELLGDGLGNLVLGHVWSQGGTMPKQEHVAVGLLGADYRIDSDRYQFARILAGENWNPKLRAPLTAPGVDVKQGDYLLAINGQDLKGSDDVSRLMMGTAGRQTLLTVGPNADGSTSRKVTVVPVGSETALRLRTWMEDNRKKVDQMSGGRVGYVFVPDTQFEGFANFNRYYFSQAGKEAVVIDERFNHGGQIADYMINVMKWTPLMGAMTREGEDSIVPMSAIFGPKVMIANQFSGSGGDALPWMFKKAKLGPLVGDRTWGGLVGIGGYPTLIDGGRVTAPRWALYGTEGKWEVENVGIAPDVEVEQDPALTRTGHDPQLEKAVQLAMEALAKTPPVKLVRPPYPDYGPRLPKKP